jgi:hypothetical protein
MTRKTSPSASVPQAEGDVGDDASTADGADPDTRKDE